ncbi:methyl-accepting chemotaxis protein [Thiomicrorhabdus sp. zzn3]|uniref:methyl-accepting chemotaxis protein n=1 Tax=Thiomicrorhabdus sp. zzn3 TaxID=3039775 RepID=UPI0024367006|nr:methyl-accepting chemotaxis protein [Thiomicrorhabdus sp. zzn3]MDG6777237.1 methyl-accepting chemotaxis protein [Thiomicrorhabdus sp. zzn3]
MVVDGVKGHSSKKSLIIYFLVFILINAFGLGAFLYLQKQHIKTINHAENEISQKLVLYNDIVYQLGYGNYIHNFKNLILRGKADYREADYREKLQENSAKLKQAFAEYRQLTGVEPYELERLQVVEKTVTEFDQMVAKAVQLRNQGSRIGEIDRNVVVDDRPAMLAIKEWHDFLQEDAQAKKQKVISELAYQERMDLSVYFVLLILLNLIAFEFLVRRDLIKPVLQLQTQLKHFCDTRGEGISEDFQVKAKGSLEINLVTEYLNRMLCIIYHNMHEVEAVKAVVDQSSANIMMADEDLVITYMNPSIVTTLKKVEKEIQEMLPHFSTEKLVGQNIDIFHVHPEHQRKLLAELKETYVAKLTLGELHLEIVVNPIWGPNGKRNGFVTEWRDVTQSVKLEQMQHAVEENLKVMVEKAAKGHIGEQIDVSVLNGFIHDLGMQINFMSKAIFDANNKISEVIQQLSQGNLTQRVVGDYEASLGEMKDAINLSLDTLSQILAQVHVSINQIAQGIEQTSQDNSELSSRIQQQAASIEETAATMEEMTSSVRNNAVNAQEANALTVQASQKMAEGADIMRQTIEAMEQIRDSSSQIEQIIGLIDSIAFQTNLLALNAAVEAARAGEHGRGFAVVAGEVRNLASKSAEAAKEIKNLIERSAQQVQKGTELAESSGSSLNQISESIRHVTEIVGEIATSSNEQARGIEQLNQAVVSLDKNTQENAHLVERSAGSAEMIAEQSRELVKQIDQFKIDEAFIRSAEEQQRATALTSVAESNHLDLKEAPQPVKPVVENKERSNDEKKNRVKTSSEASVSPMGEQWEEF